MQRYFKRIDGVGIGDYIYYLKSKGLSDENITAPSAPNKFLNPSLEYLCVKLILRFSGCCFKAKLAYIQSQKTSKHLYCL